MSTTVTLTTVRPICFMVMPFGMKNTGIMEGSAPARINFDTLWHKAQRMIARREFVKQQSAFQAEVHAARQSPIAERNERVRELLESYVPTAGCAGEAIVLSVALELLCLARDWMTWEKTIAYVERLPERVRQLPQVQEQYWLARSKAGGHLEAIGELRRLVR